MLNPPSSNPNLVIDSISFTDEFTGTGGGGVPYLNGGVVNKMVATINFHTFLGWLNQGAIFTAATKTITNNTTGSTDSFIQLGYQPGMTLAITGSSSNNGAFTIKSLTANTITVLESLTDETATTGVNIYDATPIKAIDLYYNLIGNNEPENYNSKTDPNSLQKFTVSGLDASDTSTVHSFLVGTSSFAWVTNAITNTATGETSEVTIKGAGISGHVQSFVITQTFSIAPFWLAGQFNNFQKIQPPAYFLNTCLKYICRIDGRFDNINPVINYSGKQTDNAGLTSWFNANNINTTPEYYLGGIVFTDADSNVIDAPDIMQIANVAITLKSRSGKFIALDNPKYKIDFILCDSSAANYQGTSTTLPQNLKNDNKLTTLTAASNNGNYFGTPYQVITTITSSISSANTAIINFKIDLSAAIKALLKAKPAAGRYFAVVITTQDVNITTTLQTDRVSVLCAFTSFAYNQEDATLLSLYDYFHCFPYPNTSDNEAKAFYGYEGEPALLSLPFQIRNVIVNGVQSMLQNAGIQIVAAKAGQDDFVIEEMIFDTSTTNFLKKGGFSNQQINLVQSRNFISYANDPFNTCALINDKSLQDDVNPFTSLKLLYAFVFRYEYWLYIIKKSLQYQFPIYNDIADVTDSWKVLQANGWSLKVKFTANVKGYDGFITNFISYTDITIKALGSPAVTGPVFAFNVQFFDENNIERSGVIENAKTNILATFTGNFSSLPDGFAGFFAYLFADLPIRGGINNRRFASTEFNSEEDSPFSAAAPDGAATSSRQSDNLTINFFTTTKITVGCIYDDTLQKWGISNDNILVTCKIGMLLDDIMLYEDGTEMAFEDGAKMLYER